MSNFILLLGYIFVAEKYIITNRQAKTILLATIASALVLTRLTTIIPLSLLLCAWFIRQSLPRQSIFVLSSIATMSLCLYLCFRYVPNIAYLQKYNPFELQNRQLPTIFNIAFIMIPFACSFYIKNLNQLLQSSIYFLLLPVLTSFLISTFKNGIYPCIVESYFDISYFNMILPFVIMSLVQSYEANFHQMQ